MSFLIKISKSLKKKKQTNKKNKNGAPLTLMPIGVYQCVDVGVCVCVCVCV